MTSAAAAMAAMMVPKEAQAGITNFQQPSKGGGKKGQQFIPGKGMRAREDFQVSGITNFQQPSKVRRSEDF